MNFGKIEKRPIRNIGKLDKSEDMTTVYIGNLNYRKSNKDIKQLFSKFGKVSYVRLILDPKTKRSKGIAFVQMPDRRSAFKAIQYLNAKVVDGRTLKVSIAKENLELKKPIRKEETTNSKSSSMGVKRSVRVVRKRKTTGLDRLNKYLNGKSQKRKSS